MANRAGITWTREDYIVTQSKILQSETLAMQTIKSMGLDRLPQFGGQPGKAGKPVVEGSDAALRRPPALGAFLGGLTIKPARAEFTPAGRDVRDHRSRSGGQSRERPFPNNFIEENFRSRFDAATQCFELDGRAAERNEDQGGETPRTRAPGIRARQTRSGPSTRKATSAPRNWADLEKQLTDAQADRINKEAVYELAQSGNYMTPLPAVRESPVVQDILKQQTTLSAAYTDAVSQYGPKFPKVLRIEAQLKDLDQLITKEKPQHRQPG